MAEQKLVKVKRKNIQPPATYSIEFGLLTNTIKKERRYFLGELELQRLDLQEGKYNSTQKLLQSEQDGQIFLEN